MKFKYIENDPMDEVPVSPWKMIMTMAGCIGYMVVYLIIWCYIYGFRF